MSDGISTDAYDVPVVLNRHRFTIAVEIRHVNDGRLTTGRDADETLYSGNTVAFHTLAHTDIELS